ncbi:MAG: hypothetical protein HC916_02725 [Coleofasciculaceae cyanobacterium SM2_1_6]|nr:hypothetical protein [Coleofasciculaceae cyanobacterium SM2_1_6]
MTANSQLTNSQLTETDLGAKVAENYRQQGFEVVINPSTSLIPFDLGSYRPDIIIIAKKPSDENYIIEIKKSASRISVDRYRAIAEIVAQQNGWRFLLITGDDVSLEGTKDHAELLTWEQMLQRKAQAQKFLESGEVEVAFLYLWGILEAAMRQQAKNVAIPIERFPANSLINHLYSQGELSIEQFDRVKEMQTVRDRLVHGYQSPNLTEPTQQLLELVNELIPLWKPE